MSSGYLYVLANSSIPGLVKIGKTTRLPSERADELSRVTGVATPFIVVYEDYFDDCAAAESFAPLTGQSRRHLRMRAKRLKRNVDWPVERHIDRSNSFAAPNVMYQLGIDVARCKDWPVNVHTKLAVDGYRLADNREFFRASVSDVVKAIAPIQPSRPPKSLHRDQTPMGHYLRRMKAKLGPAGATTATAHKIAVIFYTMVKNQVEYDASLWAQRDEMREKRLDVRLQKQAAQRGYKLVPLEPAA